MTAWRLHHRRETASTNLDARAGQPGAVFTADYQTAGRGRLDHKWLSPPGTNLMMSVVLSVAGLEPADVATLPLVVGLAVCEAVEPCATAVALKWPNDVLAGGRKLAGILCERHGENVIAGIGVNVGQTAFAPEIAPRATSLALLCGANAPTLARVRDAVLERLDARVAEWRQGGFAAVYPAIAARDALRGRWLSVRQTDADPTPLEGLSAGIRPDGTLDIAGKGVYAGEAHVMENFKKV